MHKRTRARRLAMLALYQADLLGEMYVQDAREWLLGRGISDELRTFALELFEKTLANAGDIDELLESVAENWHLGRMAAVDRALLRMAVSEMLYCKDTPPKVVINEAVELAKRYSTAASGAFVNGILDRIHKDHAEKR